MGGRYGYTDIDNNLRSLWQKKACGPEGAWEERGWRGGGRGFPGLLQGPDDYLWTKMQAEYRGWGWRQALGYD